MQIKLSKTQWEEAGKKAGWLKVADGVPPQDDSIFEKVKAMGIPFANHESDLYIPVTEETKTLLANYKFKTNATIFTDNITKKPWYDIPFAYKPFWDQKQKGLA